MALAALLFLFTVGSVCREAVSERKLAYVTVVSVINMKDLLWTDAYGTALKMEQIMCFL